MSEQTLRATIKQPKSLILDRRPYDNRACRSKRFRVPARDPLCFLCSGRKSSGRYDRRMLNTDLYTAGSRMWLSTFPQPRLDLPEWPAERQH